ncbi:hypothetical protein GTP41_20980 [Pseudoduganella sp. DS3]|uniref:Uncharacterized protein n=1 Tax=Pseudoduganella guangdongensis TaxID=2692179 RepID=A0A6N9HLN1_9BURK|nr:hypothetical protein [Pseudoduganella guangdongensis]MYN04571.1 hypothetical protein [Pseudoduganella guangdongensis]
MQMPDNALLLLTTSRYAFGMQAAPCNPFIPNQFPMLTLFLAATTAAMPPQPTLSDPRFKAAIEIAALRPVPKAEIKSLSLKHKGQGVSVMMYNKLGHGLELMIHIVPGDAETDELSEGGVELHGLASLTYWNSRFQRSGWPQSTNVTEVRFTAGAPYSDNAAYILRHRQSDGTEFDLICHPQSTVEARTLHLSLTGHATEFACAAPARDTKMRTWYLKDYARYLTLYTEFDGDAMLDASIQDVQFAL